MKLYRQGDSGKAICEHCKAVVPTTFVYRDVPFGDHSGVVKDILVAVCGQCDQVVAVPPQSTPAIKASREVASKSIEVILEVPYLEALDLAAYKIDPLSTVEFRKPLLVYYIHKLAQDENATQNFATWAHDLIHQNKSVMKNVPRKRLSFKVTPRINDEITEILHVTKLKKTDLIKGLVSQIDQDIVRPKTPKKLATLQTIAAVVTC